MRDVSTGRLRALLHALRELAAIDVAQAEAPRLADLVRAVFDPQRAFTSEITQFFAALNQWQSRYDLTAEEFSFFAQVLVGYVGERLDEIERLSRPIAAALAELRPRLALVVERAQGGLKRRVEEAGLDGSIAVSALAGSSLEDWEHLAGWFVARPDRPARLDQLRRDAVAAVRSLTLNLTRLSRVGVGTSSRRADFVRLAGVVHHRLDLDPADLVNAALGCYPARHLAAIAGDAGDPVPSTTSWWDGPVALVPVSLRERGDTTSRGRSSPIPDRGTAKLALHRRRAQELAALGRVDAELLAADRIEGAVVSHAALTRFEQLVGRALAAMPVRCDGTGRGEHRDQTMRCVVERMPGRTTAVSSPEGTLCLSDLVVSLSAVPAIAGEPALATAATAGPVTALAAIAPAAIAPAATVPAVRR